MTSPKHASSGGSVNTPHSDPNLPESGAFPVRLQLSRKKGFQLKSPNGYPNLVVSRPSKWGNPFWLGSGHRLRAAQLFRKSLLAEMERLRNNLPAADVKFRWIAEHLGTLEGKNLCCWCPIDLPEGYCHADVLLKLANRNRMDQSISNPAAGANRTALQV